MYIGEGAKKTILKDMGLTPLPLLAEMSSLNSFFKGILSGWTNKEYLFGLSHTETFLFIIYISRGIPPREFTV